MNNFFEENHGTSGPIKTSFHDCSLSVKDDWIEACEKVTGYEQKPKILWSGGHIQFYNTLGLVARTGPEKGMQREREKGISDGDTISVFLAIDQCL